MKSKEGTHPKSASWAGPVALLAAAGAAGLWLWQTHGAYVPLWPAAGLLELTAALGVVWLTASARRAAFSPPWTPTPSGSWPAPNAGRTRLP
jgi:hypothetical protein